MKILLLMISALGLCACATHMTGAMGQTGAHENIAETPPFIIIESAHGFDETLARAKTAIEKRELRIFAEIDHAAGAKSIGETLRPTTLIIFGNPRGGAPLMQANQLIALELPLKLLIRTNENGAGEIVYPDMGRLFAEYGLDQSDAAPARIAAAISAIANEATTP